MERTYTGSGPRVAVLGDSITVGSRPALREELSSRSLKIGALLGEGLSSGPYSQVLGEDVMLSAAEDISDDGPPVAVLALGTNDAWNPRLTLDAAQEALARYDELLSETCLVVVTVNEDAVAPDFDRSEAAAINESLRAMADQVVDWDVLADAPGALRDDTIHPSDAGKQAWARAVADGVERCD